MKKVPCRGVSFLARETVTKVQASVPGESAND